MKNEKKETGEELIDFDEKGNRKKKKKKKKNLTPPSKLS